MMTNKFSLISGVVNELMTFLTVWNWSAGTVTDLEILHQIEKLKFEPLQELNKRIGVSI